MREEWKCAGCGAWYDPAEEDECPFCENENVSEVRGVEQEGGGGQDRIGRLESGGRTERRIG